MLIVLAWIAIWLATLVVRGAGLSTAITLIVGLVGAGIAGMTLLLLGGMRLAGLHFWELGGLLLIAALVYGVSRLPVIRRQLAHA